MGKKSRLRNEIIEKTRAAKVGHNVPHYCTTHRRTIQDNWRVVPGRGEDDKRHLKVTGDGTRSS